MVIKAEEYMHSSAADYFYGKQVGKVKGALLNHVQTTFNLKEFMHLVAFAKPVVRRTTFIYKFEVLPCSGQALRNTPNNPEIFSFMTHPARA